MDPFLAVVFDIVERRIKQNLHQRDYRVRLCRMRTPWGVCCVCCFCFRSSHTLRSLRSRFCLIASFSGHTRRVIGCRILRHLLTLA